MHLLPKQDHVLQTDLLPDFVESTHLKRGFLSGAFNSGQVVVLQKAVPVVRIVHERFQQQDSELKRCKSNFATCQQRKNRNKQHEVTMAHMNNKNMVIYKAL